MQVYRHSGTVPLRGLFIALGIGFAASAILGSIYPWLIHYIPIVYLNFLCTFALGFGVGWVVGQSAVWGHIRNRAVVSFLAVMFAMVSVYFAWAGFFLVLVGPDELGLSAFDPTVMYHLGTKVYENGTWGLGKDGTIVNGAFLGIVWITEAFAIAIATYHFATQSQATYPYCESCSRWTQRNPSARIFDANGSEPYWERVKNGDLIAINEAPLAPSEKLSDSVHLHLYSCPACAQMNVLAVQHVSRSVNAKGEEKVVTKDIVKNMLVSPKESEFLQICGKDE